MHKISSIVMIIMLSIIIFVLNEFCPRLYPYLNKQIAELHTQ